MGYIFPKSANRLPLMLAGGLPLLLVVVFTGGWYYLTPDFFEVGYAPEQPVQYQHNKHVTQLGIDCRYCHSQVEESPHANIPSTSTCIACHDGNVGTDQAMLNTTLWAAHKTNQSLIKVRQSYETGEPIRWRRIHMVPHYAHFNHSVHVNAGVSCYSCHGRMDQMDHPAYQVESLGMGWCLDCHRNPEEALVDVDGLLGDPTSVTDLASVAEQLNTAGHAREIGMKLVEEKQLQPPQYCAACHY
ncbi:MAG: cytochrome c3 family protein [Planctomycetota bacterium]